MSADPMAWRKAAKEARETGRYDEALQLHLKFHREASLRSSGRAAA